MIHELVYHPPLYSPHGSRQPQQHLDRAIQNIAMHPHFFECRRFGSSLWSFGPKAHS